MGKDMWSPSLDRIDPKSKCKSHWVYCRRSTSIRGSNPLTVSPSRFCQPQTGHFFLMTGSQALRGAAASSSLCLDQVAELNWRNERPWVSDYRGPIWWGCSS